MVVEVVLGIIAPVAAAINLTCLIVWLRIRRPRIRVTVPVIQPMAEDYLSDILDLLGEVREEIRTRPYFNGEGVTYPYPSNIK
jgi:hypothetical protein